MDTGVRRYDDHNRAILNRYYLYTTMVYYDQPVTPATEGTPLTLLKKTWIAALALSLTFTTLAKGNDWHAFRVQDFAAIQEFGLCSSGKVSWNPLFALGHGFGIRGNAGCAILKGFPDRFLAAEYEVRLSYAVSRTFTVEAGGGAQTWFQKNGGTSPMASAAVSRMFFRKLSWLRAGVTAGYSLFLPKDNLTHEPGVGVMISFGKQGE